MTFDKGKVEAGVGHAKKTPLKGQRFESLEAAQAYLDRWETNWADTRIHGTTKQRLGESASGYPYPGSVGRSLNDSPISESVASTPPRCPLATGSIRCLCSVPATQ